MPKGQDIIVSVYNIHRNPDVWDSPDEFQPERFDLDGPVPNEQNTDYRFGTSLAKHTRWRGTLCRVADAGFRRRYIPFSGGPRKCVGDQFALMEAVVALAVVLKRYTFKALPGHKVGMTTGATIHTQNGLYMTVSKRPNSSQAQRWPAEATTTA